MQKRWVESEITDRPAVEKMMDLLKVDEALAALLVSRGFVTFDSARNFFRPSVDQLHDPFLMKGMENAISRIERALTNKERIMVYGDYDVDGTTAVALTYSFFSGFYHGLEYYIPDRYKEGYGISSDGIDYAHSRGITLIIALDCGIKSCDKVEYATSLGIDFIICDHHLPDDQIPAAEAVLDPKQPDCPYPYKELSGAGIGFKLIQAFASRNNIAFSAVECYLDLVAVSIASDIVPITGENRTLAYLGIQKLNNNPCHGLAALMKLAAKKSFAISDIVFSIGPRINAAGRIDDARHAVNLLISNTPDSAKERCLEIDKKNDERKGVDFNITEEALSMIEGDAVLKNMKTTVIYNENWHKGVIGIVASRLTEKYYRPTIVLTKSNDLVAGSARSVTGYDLYEALTECSDLLEQFGGHKYAAGLVLREENVKAFQHRFEEVVGRSISEDQLTQEIVIDSTIDFPRITPKFFRILKQFAPFGPMNLAPVFLTKNVYVCGIANVVGTKHLKMTVCQQGRSMVFDCIGFSLADHVELVNSQQPFDICYTIEENEWNNRKNIQLNIKGIRQSLVADQVVAG